jgi:hypothetical protein
MCPVAQKSANTRNSRALRAFMPLARLRCTGAGEFQQLEKEHKTHPMKVILTLAALFVSASLALSADEPKKPGEGKGGKDGKRPNPEEFFKKLDTNADGSLSKDEYLANPRAKQDPAKGAENFTKMDKDSDGKLTKEEFAAMAKGKGDKGKKAESN